MDTGKRNRMFKYMIIAHIAAMVLYIPATGLAYRHNNILYDILCAAVTVLEIYLCWKDERHEVFWFFLWESFSSVLPVFILTISILGTSQAIGSISYCFWELPYIWLSV